jgi:hypothetical protein
MEGDVRINLLAGHEKWRVSLFIHDIRLHDFRIHCSQGTRVNDCALSVALKNRKHACHEARIMHSRMCACSHTQAYKIVGLRAAVGHDKCSLELEL